ncbi:MAG: hypothetical protein CM15mP46_1070 [Alphaproteobacteria bacterium]|nr:MAG: hypothetical protein CM15mP46_1070 [Alphaproteobacteria bacterium]
MCLILLGRIWRPGFLQAGGESMLANCGYGHGASVRVRGCCGHGSWKRVALPTPRAVLGDAAILVADRQIRAQIGLDTSL